MPIEATRVLRFWFEELTDADRWGKAAELDRKIAERFTATHAAALAGELWRWREGPTGRLAEIVVLDQFSRHIFRGTAAAFAADPVALVLAQEALTAGADRALNDEQRAYLYMPFMHSESRVVQRWATPLFAGLERSRPYAERHRAIIERFGRYPHRNAALGRTSAPEEIAFLAEPGSSF